MRLDRRSFGRGVWGAGRRGQRGQTATEYVLVISVIVIALTGAVYSFNPTLKTSLDNLLGSGHSSSPSNLNIPSQVQRGFVTQAPK